MNRLNANWITENGIDFEYKKYVLLAYLQHVSHEFDQTKVYPVLAELIEHYKLVKSFKDNKQNIMNSFPQRLSSIDAEKFRLSYEQIIQDDQIMSEIGEIVDFSLPRFAHYLNEGKKIFDYVEQTLVIQPVGVVPLNTNHGYIFLRDGKNSDTKVYEYELTIYEQPDEVYRGIHTHYVDSYRQSFTNTYPSIKNELIRQYKKLPNPAVYAIESELTLPLEETFLPIAKRMLVKHIATN